MVGPFRFSSERMRAAARNWRATGRERKRVETARAERRFDKIDSTERIVKHGNRLMQQVHEQYGERARREAGRGKGAPGPERLPDGVRELAAKDHITADDVTPRFVERVIGETKDFMSAEFFELGVQAMRSVARIVTSEGGSVYYGTGFMVSPSLMLTNEHVLEQPLWADNSEAEFNYQRDRSGKQREVQRFALDADRFFLNDKFLDYALVAVRPAPSVGTMNLTDFGYCPLVGMEGKILQTDPVNIIQHPRGRLKEVVIRENRLSLLPSESELNHLAQYLADTEEGSSGSPVFNDRWEVIALHHQGIPAEDKDGNILTRDGGVWDSNMSVDEIRWAANEGIRISRIIRHLSERDDVPAAMAPLLEELLTNSASREVGPAKTDRQFASGESIIVLPPKPKPKPITITLQVDERGKVAAKLGRSELAEGVQPEPDYGARPGFQRDFLGVDVPMPVLVDPSRGKAAALADGTTELKYHHYSVIMNAERRLAYVSAVNYDATAPYVEERGDDAWFIDPRLDRALQADNRYYRNNPLDRGHLTRRYDAGWGNSEQEAGRANDDTFHWTNCAPQHEVFNQSKLSQPKDLRLWGELENHVTEQARRDQQRLSVFNGPVFGTDDRSHRGLRIPSAFWKIVAYVSKDDRLGAVGFVLHQGDLIADLEAERFDPGKFELRQVRISRIEELTGLDFGNLRNVDPLARTSVLEIFEGTRPTERRLGSAADIRF